MRLFRNLSVGRKLAAGALLALILLGGLVTLLMPCTYPMIPFTVNFFAKQAASGRSLLPLALVDADAGLVGPHGRHAVAQQSASRCDGSRLERDALCDADGGH